MLGLTQGRKFEQQLCGSVIPFLKIKDVKKAIHQLTMLHAKDAESCKKKVNAIKKVQLAKNAISQQLQTLQTLQKVLVADLMKAG